MSVLLDTTSIKASGSRSLLGFEQPVHEGYAGWSRYLTLDGEKAYFIGGACDTCAFVFERMGGASRNVSPGETADVLRRGLSRIEEAPISTISEFVPGGSYRVSLLQLSPVLVTPGTELDYFAHEQAALWGTDPFWGLPHHPKTEYYRVATIPLGESRRLFEFVVPMFPKGWLSKKCLTSYADRLSNGETPTALAISVLDVRGPTTREEGPEITEHWCLSHYLLDGHHKTYAAYQAERSITMLSFLATAESMATEKNVEQILKVLASQSRAS